LIVSGFYHITVGSLPDYEDLVAEIYIGDKFVGLISQEEELERFLLELAPLEQATSTKLDLAVFERAISEAKEKLQKLKRVPGAG